MNNRACQRVLDSWTFRSRNPDGHGFARWYVGSVDSTPTPWNRSLECNGVSCAHGLQRCSPTASRIAVGLQTTGYRGMHDQEGRDWITIDGNELVNMPHWYGWLVRGYVDQPDQSEEFANYASLFANGGLRSAMRLYLGMSIDDILCSENVLVRGIGMFDRRLGKRRLQSLKMEGEHPLVRLFRHVRCHAEGLAQAECGIMPGGVNLRHPILPWSRDKRKRAEERERATARLSSGKRTRRLPPLIAEIYQGKIAEDDLDNSIAREIHAGFERIADRDTLVKTLRFVESKSKLLRSAVHARGVIELTRDAAQWVRPLEQWVARSHNRDRQFSSLARHLWAVYDVPVFMDNAWLSGTPVQQQWFRHIGAGKNIRNAEGLPIPLSKKMAHYFLEAPDHYAIEAAFRYGQVLALGGDQRLADVLRETRLAQDFRDDEFCGKSPSVLHQEPDARSRPRQSDNRLHLAPAV